MGGFYAALAPQHFRRPDVVGLADELAGELRADVLVLVAEADGQFPFWTRRMGYEERSVNVQKRLS
jgi:hypothetical protein